MTSNIGFGAQAWGDCYLQVLNDPDDENLGVYSGSATVRGYILFQVIGSVTASDAYFPDYHYPPQLTATLGSSYVTATANDPYGDSWHVVGYISQATSSDPYAGAIYVDETVYAEDLENGLEWWPTEPTQVGAQIDTTASLSISLDVATDTNYSAETAEISFFYQASTQLRVSVP